jgi:glycosyltransferase EpsE
MISVIVPAYIPTELHRKLFRRAIASLEAQTFKKFEVICVLNGSCVSKDEIINDIKNCKLQVNFYDFEKKSSGAIARNYGIQMSKNSLIAQIDVDDQYAPTKLEKQYNFFQTHPEYDFVGTLASDFYFNETITDSCFSPGQYQEHEQIAKAIKHENIMCHGSIMFKKSSFIKLGGYNEINKPGTIWPEYGVRMWEDWDLWQRAVNQGMKFHNIPERLYYWSVGTSVDR